MRCCACSPWNTAPFTDFSAFASVFLVSVARVGVFNRHGCTGADEGASLRIKQPAASASVPQIVQWLHKQVQVLHSCAQLVAEETAAPGSIDISFVATDTASHELAIFFSSGFAFSRRADLLRQAHGWLVDQPDVPPPDVPLSKAEAEMAQIETWNFRDRETLIRWLKERCDIGDFFREVRISPSCLAITHTRVFRSFADHTVLSVSSRLILAFSFCCHRLALQLLHARSE